MKATLLLCLVALSVGIGLGYGLRARGRTAAPAPVKPEEAVRAWLARLPDVPVHPGEGMIRGAVRGEDGQPLAGVEIRAIPVLRSSPPEPEDGAPPEILDIEARVREFLDEERAREARTRTTVSDAHGAFELGGLDTRDRYILTGNVEGCEIGCRYDRWGDASAVRPTEAGARVLLTAHRLIPLPISLQLPDGSSPEAAEIETWRRIPYEYEPAARPWTSSAPVVSLRAGTYWLMAATREGGLYESDRYDIALLPNVPPRALVLRLEERQESNTMRRAFEEDASEFGPDAFDPALLPQSELPLIVRVQGPDGALTPAEILHAGWRTALAASDSFDAFRREDGTYGVRVRPPREEEIGRDGIEYSLTVQSEFYGSRSLSWTDPARREVTVSIPEAGEGATLEISVDGYEPATESEAWGVRVVQGARDEFLQSHRLDEKGSILVDNLDPGSCTVSTYVGGCSDVGYTEGVDMNPRRTFHPGTSERIVVDLKPGQNAMTVKKPRIWTLTVSAPGAKKGDHITLRREDRIPNRFGLTYFGADYFGGCRIPEGGTVRFEGLPPGTYWVTIWNGSDLGEMGVAHDASAVYEPKPFNALKVACVDPKGYLEAAGFRCGDIILGARGERFRSFADLGRLVGPERDAERIPLIVLRGDETIEIAVEPGAFAIAMSDLVSALWPIHTEAP